MIRGGHFSTHFSIPVPMHVNGHLDAVFVLLESARLRGGCLRFIMWWWPTPYTTCHFGS